jgi:hypothetical protein
MFFFLRISKSLLVGPSSLSLDNALRFASCTDDDSALSIATSFRPAAEEHPLAKAAAAPNIKSLLFIFVSSHSIVEKFYHFFANSSITSSSTLSNHASTGGV